MVELDAALREEGEFLIGDLVHAYDDEFEGDGKVMAWSDRYGCYCVHFADATPGANGGSLHKCDNITPDLRGRWFQPCDLKLLD